MIMKQLLPVFRDENIKMIKGAVILTIQRSGSEVLRNLLDSHPQIVCKSELFGRRPEGVEEPRWPEGTSDKEKLAFLEGYFISTPTGPLRMFKLMYNHITKCDTAWEYIVKEQIKVIRLERKDLLRRVTSLAVNHFTNRGPVSYINKPGTYQLEVDIDFLIERVKWENELYDYYDKQLDRLPSMDITYTDIVGEEGNEIFQMPGKLAYNICRFLEVTPVNLYNKRVMRKQNPTDWRKVIINHKELEERFKKEGLI